MKKEFLYVTPDGCNGCLFETQEEAFQEVERLLLFEEAKGVTIKKKFFTEKEFESLKEFGGY